MGKHTYLTIYESRRDKNKTVQKNGCGEMTTRRSSEVTQLCAEYPPESRSVEAAVAAATSPSATSAGSAGIAAVSRAGSVILPSLKRETLPAASAVAVGGSRRPRAFLLPGALPLGEIPAQFMSLSNGNSAQAKNLISTTLKIARAMSCVSSEHIQYR